MDMDVNCDAYSFQHPYSKIKKISFHLFPKDRETKQKWIDAIRTFRKGYLPTKTSVLCSEHFVVSDFTPRGMRLVLRPSSVPTVFDEALMRKQKAIIRQYELDANNKNLSQFGRKNFSYKNYKAQKTPPQLTPSQLNLKLKPELVALLQKRNKPILLRRKPKETGNKKQIPECIWVMPSGSISTTSPFLPRSNNSSTSNISEGSPSRKFIQLVIPKRHSSTDINRNYSQLKNKFGPNTSQSILGCEEFVKEEQEIDYDHFDIKELIKQEHEYCIKSERIEPDIKEEFPEIENEFPFVEMKKQNALRVRTYSELKRKRPEKIEVKEEPELIIPELIAEIKTEPVDESNQEEYFEFVDVDMTHEDVVDYQEDTLRNTQTEEQILS